MVATPYGPLALIEGIPAINGPASVNAKLIDGITTANYEGIWVPWLYVKQGSLELSGSMSTLSCQLYGTNVISPLNSYTITMGGAATNNDIVTINFGFPGATIAVQVTITTSETTTQMATAVAAAINASTLLQAYGVQASSVNAVVTTTWPSISPSQGYGFYTTSSPTVSPALLLTSSVSGGATETVAFAPGAGGSALGSAITALGMTQFTFSARWLKLRMTTLTGGNATITGIAQGTA